MTRALTALTRPDVRAALADVNLPPAVQAALDACAGIVVPTSREEL